MRAYESASAHVRQVALVKASLLAKPNSRIARPVICDHDARNCARRIAR